MAVQGQHIGQLAGPADSMRQRLWMRSPGVIVQDGGDAAGGGALGAVHRPHEGVEGRGAVRARPHSRRHLLVRQSGSIGRVDSACQNLLGAASLCGGGLRENLLTRTTV